jgi:hypothetical protein
MAQPSKKKVTAKPAVKVKAKMASQPKVTKSRGSKTPKQMGDMNQREWFNAQRDVKQKRTKSGKIIGSTVPGFKVSKADADSQGFDMAAERKRQRAGGAGGKGAAAKNKLYQVGKARKR